MRRVWAAAAGAARADRRWVERRRAAVPRGCRVRAGTGQRERGRRGQIGGGGGEVERGSSLIPRVSGKEGVQGCQAVGDISQSSASTREQALFITSFYVVAYSCLV